MAWNLSLSGLLSVVSPNDDGRLSTLHCSAARRDPTKSRPSMNQQGVRYLDLPQVLQEESKRSFGTLTRTYLRLMKAICARGVTGTFYAHARITNFRHDINTRQS